MAKKNSNKNNSASGGNSNNNNDNDNNNLVQEEGAEGGDDPFDDSNALEEEEEEEQSNKQQQQQQKTSNATYLHPSHATLHSYQQQQQQQYQQYHATYALPSPGTGTGGSGGYGSVPDHHHHHHHRHGSSNRSRAGTVNQEDLDDPSRDEFGFASTVFGKEDPEFESLTTWQKMRRSKTGKLVLCVTLTIVIICLIGLIIALMLPYDSEESLLLQQLDLPRGFYARSFASGLANISSIAVAETSASRIVFVSQRTGNTVYALIDKELNNKSEETLIVSSSLENPNGLAFKSGDLFVCETTRLLRFKGIENAILRGENGPFDYEVMYEGLYNDDTEHGFRYMDFSPFEDALYISVPWPNKSGLEYNATNPFGVILKFPGPNYNTWTVVSRGVRYSLGMDWQKANQRLWFVDSNDPYFGVHSPNEEINMLPKTLLENDNNYGYPQCYGCCSTGPEYAGYACPNGTITPSVLIEPHAFSRGIRFYSGNGFPAEYTGSLFVCNYGSILNDYVSGFNIIRILMDPEHGNPYSTIIFASGFIDSKKQEIYGQPMDVDFLNDGSLIFTDSVTGSVINVYYST